MGAVVRQPTDVSPASLIQGIFEMDKAKRPGSAARSGQKSRSKRGGQTPNRSDDRKIAQANPSLGDLSKERGHRSAGARKSKLSSQGPQQANYTDPLGRDPFESELLKPNEAADLTIMSESWLAKKRMEGNGPPFLKLGRAVRYRKRDLVAWLATRVKISTSQ
jgi:predicted DNA-binding transcriptional regulator AlpA